VAPLGIEPTTLAVFKITVTFTKLPGFPKILVRRFKKSEENQQETLDPPNQDVCKNLGNVGVAKEVGPSTESIGGSGRTHNLCVVSPIFSWYVTSTRG
jgi:hypothetical protein